jgi:pyruvate,water dikinase
MKMTKGFILWFDNVGRDDSNLVGAKCANLGEMVSIGVPVPPGFAVTTRGFQGFLEETGADEKMQDVFKKFPEGPQNISDCEEISKKVQEIIMSLEVPGGLRDAIYQTYNQLSQKCGMENVSTAVRSSGVAEDLPDASFAGQYESYLNVRGKEQVVEMVRSCWASLYTTRAVSYRQKNKLAVDGGAISVAVMKMINTRSAGIAFTAHPSTGDTTKIVLEGSWGAGESVVQGVVSPDQYIIDKNNGQLATKQINEKSLYTVLTEDGIEEREVPEDFKCKACLSDEEAEKIAEHIKNVEVHYGVPLDLEWAVDDDLTFPNNIYLVQSRPITVIAKKKEPTEKILDMMMNRFYRT